MAGFVVGNFAKVFIALVNFTDWTRRQRISSADQTAALAVSRIGLLRVMFINWISTLFNPAVNSSPLSIYSLCKHLRNKQLNGKGYQNPSTKVHVRALQTVSPTSCYLPCTATGFKWTHSERGLYSWYTLFSKRL
ncbi:LOW QUALITY PROTEIN: taste receptor type 2 member 20-like [Erethizon dorsatum]